MVCVQEDGVYDVPGQEVEQLIFTAFLGLTQHLSFLKFFLLLLRGKKLRGRGTKFPPHPWSLSLQHTVCEY